MNILIYDYDIRIIEEIRKYLNAFLQMHKIMRYVTDFNKKDVCLDANNRKFTLPISQRRYLYFNKSYFAYIGV